MGSGAQNAETGALIHRVIKGGAGAREAAVIPGECGCNMFGLESRKMGRELHHPFDLVPVVAAAFYLGEHFFQVAAHFKGIGDHRAGLVL